METGHKPCSYYQVAVKRREGVTDYDSSTTSDYEQAEFKHADIAHIVNGTLGMDKGAY